MSNPTTSRRAFLRNTAAAGTSVIAGIALVGCASRAAPVAAWRPSPGDASAARVPVEVAGRRVRTIDVHAHCYIPEALELLGAVEAKATLPPVRGQQQHFIVVDERLAAMDAMGIDMKVLSINPFWYRQARSNAESICRLQNEKLAELCRARPDRFGAFASIALQYPDLAVAQLDDAVRRLGLRGAAIGGSVAGEDFSAPRFHPVWAKAEELGATLFIHPQSAPELARRFKGNGWMSNVIGNPLDTTIALQHLIFEGVLDKFPGLKICAAHGGGYVGMNAPRMDFGCYVSPINCDPSIVLKKRPSEYIRQMYFDALVFTPEALRHLVAEVGATQVVLGTDHPIPWETHPVDHVMHTPALSDADREAILGGNAARMLGLDR
ncbi:MAG: amidohydrolase family protein [Xylophilus ampelinus]